MSDGLGLNLGRKNLRIFLKQLPVQLHNFLDVLLVVFAVAALAFRGAEPTPLEAFAVELSAFGAAAGAAVLGYRRRFYNRILLFAQSCWGFGVIFSSGL